MAVLVYAPFLFSNIEQDFLFQKKYVVVSVAATTFVYLIQKCFPFWLDTLKSNASAPRTDLHKQSYLCNGPTHKLGNIYWKFLHFLDEA